MSFANLISRVPRAIDPERGMSAVAEVGAAGPVADLILGAAGTSPYLADLVRAEANWLAETLSDKPNIAFASLMSSLNADGQDTPRLLRQAKRRVALLVGLADLGGVWSLEEVTANLTRFADAAVSVAARSAIAAEIRRGKLPGQTEDDLASCGGLAVLAMGKMGAFELNYSSDIDLICLYDETRFDTDDYGDARSSFVRAVRRMAKDLSERTAEGYVFRTDLRLRPDASVTPVAISMEAAERYYEAFGRTWERAAYIKARAAAGDVTAGETFLKGLQPFVWRRHLDFAAIQDAHDMRLRIRDHKGLHREITHLGHDLKLGAGGIREIEFFTQTRQIIAGGRDPDLRVPTTKGGLTALAEASWISADDAAFLSENYEILRHAEHRVQMIADQQTHRLPATEVEFDRVAALFGTDSASLAQDLTSRCRQVQALIDGFFERRSGSPVQETPEPEGAREHVSRWKGYPALRSPRAVEIFEKVRPALFARLSKASDPGEAMQHFDGFLSGLPAGVQLFSLFEANPQLLDLVIDIADTAPALGRHLSRNAQVFDAVIGGDFFTDWPGAKALSSDFSEELDRVGDYEARLDRIRVVAREWRFRIGVHHLRGLIAADEAGRQYADVAEATIAAIWPHVVDAFADKHGAPPGRGAAILGMGSLGAGRLTAASDLDLIVIYDGAGEETSDGRRPLATRLYYSRLTQALVTAVSAPTAEGRLYEVDMRLRPSGRQGPVATGLASFRDYQLNEAWTWEHLALTRARPVAGTEALFADIAEIRAEVLEKTRERAAVLADVADMRVRLAEGKQSKGPLDTKAGPGRMQDIELFAQTAALLKGNRTTDSGEQLDAVAQAFDIDAEDMALLKDAAVLFRQVQSASRLIVSGALEADGIGAGPSAFLLRDTGAESVTALAERIAEISGQVTEIIDRHIGGAADTSSG